jgi:phosphotransferase system HPr (HPr) family protein
MIEFKTVVNFEEGLHARPASELVKACQAAASDIKISKGAKSVNPKSILGILTLAAGHLDELKIEVDGSDEVTVAERLKEFFAKESM